MGQHVSREEKLRAAAAAVAVLRTNTRSISLDDLARAAQRKLPRDSAVRMMYLFISQQMTESERLDCGFSLDRSGHALRITFLSREEREKQEASSE